MYEEGGRNFRSSRLWLRVLLLFLAYMVVIKLRVKDGVRCEFLVWNFDLMFCGSYFVGGF